MALALETLLSRQKEVFDTFIANNGREVSIMPLVKKYIIEDGVEDNMYSYTKIFDYMNMYINSNQPTEEELETYKKVTTISDETKLKRGKEIVLLLIENRMHWKEVSILAKKFAMEDGKLYSYPSETMHEWRKFFLQNNHDEDIIRNYNIARELNKKRVSTNYDVLLIDKLLEFESQEKAVTFIEQLKISRTSLKALLDAYKVLFPTKKDEAQQVDELINEAFKDTPLQPKKFAEYTIEKRQDRIIRFKNLLEEYTISDIERISDLFEKYNFTKYSFPETLKDMQVSNDKIISLLIDKYEIKVATIMNKRINEINQIINGLFNGINYNGTYYKMNLYDIKMITDMPIEELMHYAFKFIPRQDYTKFKKFMDNKLACRKYPTKQELFESVNYGKSGRMATDEEKWAVIDFMEEQGWPYQTQLFMDTISRYMDNLIDLHNNEVIEEDIPKMNK